MVQQGVLLYRSGSHAGETHVSVFMLWTVQSMPHDKEAKQLASYNGAARCTAVYNWVILKEATQLAMVQQGVLLGHSERERSNKLLVQGVLQASEGWCKVYDQGTVWGILKEIYGAMQGVLKAIQKEKYQTWCNTAGYIEGV